MGSYTSIVVTIRLFSYCHMVSTDVLVLLYYCQQNAKKKQENYLLS